MAVNGAAAAWPVRTKGAYLTGFIIGIIMLHKSIKQRTDGSENVHLRLASKNVLWPRSKSD